MLRGQRWRAGGDLHALTVRTTIVSLWLSSAWVALNATYYYVTEHGVGMDAHAYWLGARLEHPYGPAPTQRDAYLYSPLFAQVTRVIAWLPFPVFCAVFTALCLAACWWLLRPLSLGWRVPALLLCAPTLLIGNVYPLLCAAFVLAASSAAWLPVQALTKVTPTAVGLVWYAVRGDWRLVWRALGATAVLVLASAAFEPHLWVEWVRFLLHHGGDRGWSFPVRLVLAVALTVLGARRRSGLAIAVAFYLSMPLAGLGFQSLLCLMPAVRIRGWFRHQAGRQPAAGDAGQRRRRSGATSAQSSTPAA